MVDIFIGAIVGLYGGAWMVIISILCQHIKKLYSFNKTLGKAPDCCMCGAIDPYECGNHAYTPQRDWLIENHQPKFD